MSDPFEALHAPATPVDPDPIFTARLRDRLRRALLEPQGATMPSAGFTTKTITKHTGKKIPQHALTPYLAVNDARRALDWYAQAFDAQLYGELYEMEDGRIGHAEIVIGDSLMAIADEYPELDLLGPTARGGPSQSLHLQVPDVDATVQRAVDLGAELVYPISDEPYGRGGTFIDPFGHRWMILTPPAETPSLRQGDVGYVSLWVPDLDLATDFYGSVLGWHYAPSSGHQGRQVAGLTQHLGLWASRDHRTSFLCFAVDDLQTTIRAIHDAGGTAEDPTPEPYGTVSRCADDQGMPFAVFEPAEQGGPAHPAQPGEISYLTLQVPDSDRARAFYGAVLNWDFAPGRSQGGWRALIRGDEGRIMTGLHGGHPQPTVVPMYVVDDLQAAVDRVRAAGGTASDPEQQPYGTTATCTDNQDVAFYLAQH